MYKGKPVDGATIVFVPVDPKGHAAAAVTDGAGRFVMAAFPPDPGAVPGKYGVTITKMSASPTAAVPEAGHDADLYPVPPPQSLVPAKYSDATRSGLTADVPSEGKTDFQFDLTD